MRLCLSLVYALNPTDWQLLTSRTPIAANDIASPSRCGRPDPWRDFFKNRQSFKDAARMLKSL